MKEFNNNELKDIFDDKSLKKSLRKAKLVAIFRVLLISVFVCILIIYQGNKINNSIMAKKSSEVITELTLQDTVMKESNTIIYMNHVDIGLFKGTIEREIYKIIEDQIIPWGTETANFGLRGFESMDFSSYSTNIDSTTQINIPSGEREMLFYVPQYKYDEYANDLSKIKEYPDSKYIEMAISFDKSYSLDEVKEMLPKSVNQTWYWVDSYSDEAKLNGSDYMGTPKSGKWLFGISDISSKLGRALSTVKIKDESDFLENLKKFSEKDYKFIKNHQKGGLIIGVVVTGTKESLLPLQGQPYVKASSLGVVVDKY